MRASTRWIGAVFIVGSLFLSVMTLTGAHGGAWATLAPASKVLSVAAFVLAPALIAARFGLWRLAAPGPGSGVLLAALIVALVTGGATFAMPFTVSSYGQAWEPGGVLYGINYSVLPALGVLANLLTALGVLRLKLEPRWVGVLGLVSAAAWVAAQVGMALSRALVSLEGVIAAGVLAIVAPGIANGFYLGLGFLLVLRPRTKSELHGQEVGGGSPAAGAASATT